MHYALLFWRIKTETTSHMCQGPWPCCCEGMRFSSKGCTTNMVCWNLCHAYLLEVGLMQIPTNHDTLSIVCHVEIHVDFSFMIITLDLHLRVWSELGRSRPFRPMRDLRLQWSRAFSLECEGALRSRMAVRFLTACADDTNCLAIKESEPPLPHVLVGSKQNIDSSFLLQGFFFLKKRVENKIILIWFARIFRSWKISDTPYNDQPQYCLAMWVLVI